MSAPAVVIRLELEAAPIVYVDTIDEGESLRLEDWIDRHPAQRDLIARALELSNERAA